jgi:hypothetical protein
MIDPYFKLMIWKNKPPIYGSICIETGPGSVFLQQDEIQKLVQFLIVHKKALGYKGEL